MCTTQNTSIRYQLDALLDTGRQMFASASDGDWDKVSECQASCHARATAIFSNPLSVTDAAAVADAVNTVLALHKEVMQLCRQSRDTHLQDLDSLNQGRQAVNEYTANSG